MRFAIGILLEQILRDDPRLGCPARVQIRIGQLCLCRPQRSVETGVDAQLDELDQSRDVRGRADERVQHFNRLREVAGKKRRIGGDVDAAECGLDAPLRQEIERDLDDGTMLRRVDRERAHERRATLQLVPVRQLSGRRGEHQPGILGILRNVQRCRRWGRARFVRSILVQRPHPLDAVGHASLVAAKTPALRKLTEVRDPSPTRPWRCRCPPAATACDRDGADLERLLVDGLGLR